MEFIPLKLVNTKCISEEGFGLYFNKTDDHENYKGRVHMFNVKYITNYSIEDAIFVTQNSKQNKEESLKIVKIFLNDGGKYMCISGPEFISWHKNNIKISQDYIAYNPE